MSNSVQVVDQRVFERFRDGQPNAFEMIFNHYYRPLCAYAYSFLHDRDHAEEVVQSAFITLWEKRESIAIDTSFQSYLYRMIRNACLNVIKHEKVKQQHTVLAQELETKIHQAMRTLPEQCRLVFQLSRFEELKYHEIAAQLNISVKTVENHMGKALRMMREQLKEYLPLMALILGGIELW
jgi:RNA polymerase sigma-70 factor, ECF subfamily